MQTNKQTFVFHAPEDKVVLSSAVIHADTGGQKCAMNYEPTLITHNFFFRIFIFQKEWRIFFDSNQSEAVSSWKLRCVCTHCCNLQHFLLCSKPKPFSEAAAEVFKSFSERAFFSSLKHPTCVGVIILRATARVRLGVKPTSNVLLSPLFVHAENQRVPGEFGCEWIDVTADEARRDFLRSPVAVNVIKLALDQVTTRHCLLASTVSESPPVPLWQKLVREAVCLERKKWHKLKRFSTYVQFKVKKKYIYINYFF